MFKANLTFKNRTAAEFVDGGLDEEITDITLANMNINVLASQIEHVSRWYHAFCSGDDIKVLLNGRVLDIDCNGEPERSGFSFYSKIREEM